MAKKKKRKIFLPLLIILLIVAFTIIVILFGIKYFFPINYLEYINEYSSEYNLPASLVCGVIKTESGFDENAVSNKDAYGLMQLTIPTAEWINETLEIDNFSDDMITDPETNIEMGCYYLRCLLDKYDNNTDLALAAYNAGEGRVDKWLEDPTVSSDGQNLNNVPYPETKQFIKKVTVYSKIYEIILTHPMLLDLCSE